MTKKAAYQALLIEVKFVTIHGKAAYQALLMEVISVVWYVFRRIAGLGPQDRPQNMHPISHVEGVQIPVPGILLSTPNFFCPLGVNLFQGPVPKNQ